MSMIYKGIEELVGKTPLIELERYSKELGLDCQLFGKLEFMNPTGSIKDRVALNIIIEAEKKGELKSGGTIIEATSGNTGIGLAAIGTARGYDVKIVMPDNMSSERIKMMKAYGACVVLTQGEKGMTGSIEKAQSLKNEIENSFLANQFENTDNTMAHYINTGKEIWEDTEGKVDIVISTIGTGGTITGIGKFLKEKNKKIEIIGIEPKTSNVISGGSAGTHKIQGIGAGFIPEILDLKFIDRIVEVDDDKAYEKARLIGKLEGIFLGISSGAVLQALDEIKREIDISSKNIVVIFPDGGSKYLSTENFIEV